MRAITPWRRTGGRGLDAPGRGAAALGILVCGLFLRCPAQPAGSLEGIFHYAVENLDRGEVEQRGLAGTSGVAFDRLILASGTRYRIWLLEAATLRVAEAVVETGPPGRRVNLPDFEFREASSPDSDADGLSDLGEFIVGTDPWNPDTDGDGIPDGAEVRQGTDPLSGRAVRTGIIATAAVSGVAHDISAADDLAFVAGLEGGVGIYNVFAGLNPTRIAQVDTPGRAQAVAGAGTLVAVADGSAGLAILDISDPPAAHVRHQVSLGGEAVAVATGGPIAYVGLGNGELVAVDLPSGAVLEKVRLGAAVQDVTLAGDMLYVLQVGRVLALPIGEGGLQVAGQANSPGVQGAGRRRLRLFAGDRHLYATHMTGYNILDISEGGLPRFVRAVTTAQFGWKQIVDTGSGLGVAAVSPNSTDDGPHHISLYRLGDGTQSEFLTTFDTPGVAAAVSIYNGLAYVADSAAGLQVINYLAYDALGVPPRIGLESRFVDGGAEEGKLMRLTARVGDDVQVRNVEFFRDGRLVATDGNFPFEHRFVTPLIADGRDTFTVRARATDTGGNATWSPELEIRLIPDATPPRVTRTIPFNGALVGSMDTVVVFFSEPMLAASLAGGAVRVLWAGPDDLFGTADDRELPGALEYRETVQALFVSLDPLEPGAHRIEVRPPAADLAGNPVAQVVTANFRVFSFLDADGDGIPDELEPGLGFDPTKIDTNGNGIPDGEEDLDGDGLPTAWEILHGYDPLARDTDGNGIPDGLEDPDGDGLDNLAEWRNGTDPRRADTDGDGWSDEAEVTGGSDPLNPASRPRLLIVGARPVAAALPSVRADEMAGPGTFVGRPPARVLVPAISAGGDAILGVHVGRPPVRVLRPATSTSDNPEGVVVGRPPVTVRREP